MRSPVPTSRLAIPTGGLQGRPAYPSDEGLS